MDKTNELLDSFPCYTAASFTEKCHCNPSHSGEGTKIEPKIKGKNILSLYDFTMSKNTASLFQANQLL